MPNVPSASEKYQDILTTHSVDVLGFEATLQKQVLGILKRLESDLVAAIVKVDVGGVSATSYRKARLQALLRQTRESIRSAYGQASTDTRTQLYGFGKTESEFTAGALNRAIGLDVATVALAPEALRALAKGTLIQGAASNKWWVKQARNTEHRFELAMQTGTAQGESLGDLVKRVRGTKEKGYADGIMVASRREAQALVRTSVQAVANTAREETYAANDDIVKGLVWVSTMDARTTPICIAHSGKEYTLAHRPVGHSVPWGAGPGKIHWNCRSTSIAVLKSWNELGAKGAIRTGGRPSDIRAMFEKQMASRGMSAEQMSAAKMNMRASLNGQVPEDISFDAWLKKRPAGFQNELLGKGKAELFRAGQLPLTDLLDQRGRTRTLEQLRMQAEIMQAEVQAIIKGLTSGMSKTDYFIDSLRKNEIVKMTDDELQVMWDAEFPAETHGKRYTVKEIRSMWNSGFYIKRGTPMDFGSTKFGAGGKIIKAAPPIKTGPPPGPKVKVTPPPGPGPAPGAGVKPGVYLHGLPLENPTGMMASDETLAKFTARNYAPGQPLLPENFGNMTPADKIAYWAQKNNMTEDEFRATAEALLQENIDKMDLRVRIYDTTIEKILKDGRLKSQFEAGDSAGIFDPGSRAKIEEHLLGLGPNTQPHLRPVYGYMSPNESGLGMVTQDLSGYGNVSIKLKSVVRNRAFMCMDDSFIGTSVESGRASVIPSQLDQPRIHSFWTKRSVNPLDVLKKGPEGLYKEYQYVEAQITGGVDVIDIESIAFREEALYEKYRVMLAEKGVRAELYNVGAKGGPIKMFGREELLAEQAAARVAGTDLGKLQALYKKYDEQLAEIRKKKDEIIAQIRPLHEQLADPKIKFGSPGWKALSLEVDKFGDARAALNKQIEAVEAKLKKEMHEVIFLPPAQRASIYQVKLIDAAKIDTATKASMEQGMESFQSLIPKKYLEDELQQQVVYLNPRLGTGAEYMEGNREANVGRGNTDRYILEAVPHELGHWLEARARSASIMNKTAAEKELRAFWKRRTDGEKLTKITGTGLSGQVVGYKDKFIDHYMGRVYEPGYVRPGQLARATEIVSMGLEYLVKDPVKLMREDADMFEFIMKFIGRGGL